MEGEERRGEETNELQERVECEKVRGDSSERESWRRGPSWGKEGANDSGGKARQREKMAWGQCVDREKKRERRDGES